MNVYLSSSTITGTHTGDGSQTLEDVYEIKYLFSDNSVDTYDASAYDSTFISVTLNGAENADTIGAWDGVNDSTKYLYVAVKMIAEPQSGATLSATFLLELGVEEVVSP